LVTSKVNVDRLGEVRNASAEHVRWVEVSVALSTVFASETSGILDDLLSAVFGLASWVVDPVIILDLGDISIEEEVVELVHIVGTLESIIDLTD